MLHVSRSLFTRSLALTALVAPQIARAQAPISINAAITPVYYDAVPILYAQKTGMFAKAGIDLQLGRLPTGAAITAAVAGGALDLGKATFTPVVSAFGHGLPLTILAPAVVYDAKSPNGALVVAKDSPLHGVSDLVGKIVAVNNLTDPTRPAIDRWLEQNNLNPAAVKYAEMNMSTMAPALDAGRVDVVMLTSPIMDEVLATGKYRSFAPVMNYIAPRWLFSSYFSTHDWASKHRDAVKRFAEVIAASNAYTNAHHGELSAMIAELIGATEAAVARMTWPTAGTALVPAEMQPMIEIALKYGFIPKRFDAREMIFDPAKG